MSDSSRQVPPRELGQIKGKGETVKGGRRRSESLHNIRQPGGREEKLFLTTNSLTLAVEEGKEK